MWQRCKWNQLWSPSTLLNPNRWGQKILSWRLFRIIRWVYNFCIVLGRIRWDKQQCRDLIVTLGSVVLYVYSLYLVLGFLASHVASAHNINASCSAFYVTIPGSVPNVSLITASPSNPAKGTYYFAVVNGTTGWLDGIAPPNQTNTLHSMTLDIDPAFSPPVMGAYPPGQPREALKWLSSTSAWPSLPSPPRVTTVSISTLLSVSTLVTTVTTGVLTVNLPFPPPSFVISVCPLPSVTGTSLAPSWPSPVLPISSGTYGPGLSAVVPPQPPTSLLGLLSSTLILPGPPTPGSVPSGLSSPPMSTTVSIVPGMPPTNPTTVLHTSSNTPVVLTSTVLGSTTILIGLPPTATPVTLTTTFTSINTFFSTLMSQPTTIVEPTSPLGPPSPISPTTSTAGSPWTSTYSGGATSLLIEVSSIDFVQPPLVTSHSLAMPPITQVITMLTTILPDGSPPVVTVTSIISVAPPQPTPPVSQVWTAPQISNIVTTVTRTASDLRPTTTILTILTTISQAVPSQHPSPPLTSTSPSYLPSVATVLITTTIQDPPGVTRTVVIVSTTSVGVPSSSLALPHDSTSTLRTLITPTPPHSSSFTSTISCLNIHHSTRSHGFDFCDQWEFGSRPREYSNRNDGDKIPAFVLGQVHNHSHPYSLKPKSFHGPHFFVSQLVSGFCTKPAHNYDYSNTSSSFKLSGENFNIYTKTVKLYVKAFDIYGKTLHFYGEAFKFFSTEDFNFVNQINVNRPRKSYCLFDGICE
ncbi:hypothetical protein NX059_004703 [Plenodomus lindquistii]|nr:hypothetical protein NX059_004703 [Plenodomus lindquistii]